MRHRPPADGSVSIDLHADGVEGLVGMQFGLNWDGQVLRLEGIDCHQLPGFSQQAHSHLREGRAVPGGLDRCPAQASNPLMATSP